MNDNDLNKRVNTNVPAYTAATARIFGVFAIYFTLGVSTVHASRGFVEFVSLLRSATTSSDVRNAWNVLDAPHDSLRVVTVLSDYSKNVTFPGIEIRNLSGKRIVTPYFLGDSLYFSSRKIIAQTIVDGEIKIPLDGSIMLDTNIASYISTYVYRRSFGNNQAEIVNVIHQLLENNPNYDYLYYLVENSKKLIDRYDFDDAPDVDQLWSDLDIGFKDNLIALRLFLSIDNKRYRACNNDSPTISTTEAEDVAKRFTHDFYFGAEGASNFVEIKKRLTLARILLYKIVSIHFGSNEGVKKKATKLLTFMIDRLNTYFDREMQIAIKYFEEGKKFSFFEKIDKGKHISANSIRTKIGNMAWDLMIPRFIESLSAVAGNGRFFIPHYLTWDEGLKMSLNLYKAKACIFDDETGRVVTISEVDTERLLRETVGDALTEMYFNAETASKRYKTPPLPDSQLVAILAEVESELYSVAHA
ncbi:hypothetical protein [Candidatus Ferrigenium straubiae]|uniref:hypothetical protein n=1 Tax=Candidatus Ferrigenium straubiae TaxID=2919506 RepID=UPI003F4AD3A7